HAGLERVFALADERRLPVLVHAGRGIPALGRHALEVTARHPGLRLIFGPSWWAAADGQALIALVPPGQILMASDAPYGSPTWAAVMTTRNALQLGLDAEQAAAVAGGQALRIVNGEDPLDLGSAPGSERLSRDPLLDRVYSFLMSALGQMF